MAEVVDFGVFNAGDAEVAIDGSANVSNQKRIAGFGNEKGGVAGFGPDFEVVLDGGFGKAVKRNVSGRVRFVSANFEEIFLKIQVLKLNVGQFTDTNSGLKKEFDNGVHTWIFSASIAKGAIFHGRENSGRLDFVFGVFDFYSGIVRGYLFLIKKLEKRFD